MQVRVDVSAEHAQEPTTETLEVTVSPALADRTDSSRRRTSQLRLNLRVGEEMYRVAVALVCAGAVLTIVLWGGVVVLVAKLLM